MHKPVDEETKRQQERASRRIQRRQRVWKHAELLQSFKFITQLLERRVKYAIGDELQMMNMLSEKYMSDEETDDDQFFIRRTLSWRSPKLNKLISKLDKRYKNKDDLRPLKPRRNGEPSTRACPKNAIPWAVCAEAVSGVVGSENTEQVDAPVLHLETTEDAESDAVVNSASGKPDFDTDQLCSNESDEDSDDEMES